MKKNFVYAMLSAIALTGAVSFSACSSSDDVSDVNPAFDGEAVKTQFSISLPFNKNATTRQTGDVVQLPEDINSFRGMSDIVLIPFQNATARTARLGDNITLGASKMIKPIFTNEANSIPNGKLLAASNAVLYNDVTIPLGTSAFIFYGKAPETTGNEFGEGRLNAENLTGETSAITFKPTPILTGNPDTGIGVKLATYVSSIAAAKDATDATITWAGCANTGNSAQPWYSAGLGDLYTKFTSMKAGASSYVQAAVQDLYASIYKNTDKVSVAIKNAILKDTYGTTSTTDGVLTFDSGITGYPGNIKMPEGAAALTWSDATPKVATAVAKANFGNPYDAQNNPTGLEESINLVAMSSIVYPASLYYYVDSDIKTSNTSRADDYNGTDTWGTILGKYSSGTSVSSATRSVAITKPIQYAVGRLDVTVNKLSQGHYYDRKGEEITIPSGGFQLTGVLIGGQKAVDYTFTQTGNIEYTIYDKTINSNPNYVTSSSDATTTYTMALQTAENQNVYVALEFVNNSTKDFQGYDGVVKSGCKFYMIAQLNPNATTGVIIPTGYSDKKVFKQDYKTIAGFTFGAGTADANNDGVSDTPGGFANAYVTIPDLRTPQLELGLSVNLKWEEGITFNVTF